MGISCNLLRFTRAAATTLLCAVCAACGYVFPAGAAFVVVTEDDVLNGKSGTVLTCPAHDGATPHPDDHVAEVLREAKAKTPDGSFSAWVCRFRQLPTLALAAGLADRIYVDPFIDLSDRGPEPGESVWPTK